jgi:formate hydrogenlyase subunit 6/NADH:ubiquinone oxidoreductase subunit I
MRENSDSNAIPAVSIDQSLCTFCAGCSSVCPTMAILIHDHSSAVTGACIRCGNCIAFCPVSAVKHSGGKADENI